MIYVSVLFLFLRNGIGNCFVTIVYHLSDGKASAAKRNLQRVLFTAGVGEYLLSGYFLISDISLILWTFLKNRSLSEM